MTFYPYLTQFHGGEGSLITPNDINVLGRGDLLLRLPTPVLGDFQIPPKLMMGHYSLYYHRELFFFTPTDKEAFLISTDHQLRGIFIPSDHQLRGIFIPTDHQIRGILLPLTSNIRKLFTHTDHCHRGMFYSCRPPM